ncbi:MAG: hypothetical protein ACJAWO_002312 [Halieaceae bacterium]|jgi:hypothetical protein
MPVIMGLLLGEHEYIKAKELVNRTPSFVRASKLGVEIPLVPIADKRGPWSSVRIKTMIRGFPIEGFLFDFCKIILTKILLIVLFFYSYFK